MQRSEAHPHQTIGDVLVQLAQRIEWLRPDHRDPHRFHEEKSDIAYELHRLATDHQPTSTKGQIP